MTSENVKRALQKAADRAARLAEADASSSRDPGADKEDVPKTDRKQAALDKAKERSRTLVGVMYAAYIYYMRYITRHFKYRYVSNKTVLILIS